MPKNTGLKLFTKTWPIKKEKKKAIKSDDDERTRPLTATLEKPTILDIRFIGKIDMTMLNISTLCKLPLVIKRSTNTNRNLSADSSRKSRKKRKKHEASDESHEDDESSVIQSAKIDNSRRSNGRSSKSSGRLITGNKPAINVSAMKNDANNNNNNNYNNNRTSLRVLLPSRKPPALTTIATPIVRPLLSDGVDRAVKSSTKLPSPCKACGRPNLPERFHSHPATPSVASPRDRRSRTVVAATSDTGKLLVKSTVQKPIAIRYQSKNVPVSKTSSSPTKKLTSNPVSSVQKPPRVAAKQPKSILPVRRETSSPREPEMGRKSVTPLRGGSGKRTLTCYICGREFGTASLSLHEPKCLEKWERENASLPPNQRRKAPIKPEGDVSQKEWNQLAWESSQATLVPCPNCGRTFYPDRLEVHQRSCKVPINNSKKSLNDTPLSTSGMSQTSPPPIKGQPPAVECYICGKPFGTHSIAIHEKQCLKKWHAENDSLPSDMRSPAPTKNGATASEGGVATPTPPPKKDRDERPASGAKSPLFPCYLCGKLFTVNSIYIHEPQCLKMWKIENDKLPASKRRPVPLKPDVKFTQTGKTNIEETSEAYWRSHLNQLVPCKMCSRTFNPDRVAVHERSCKGN